MKEKGMFEDYFKIKDEETGKKIVYITADKSCIKYAHRLQTLISETNNVKCCIYTKNVYINNMHKASSDNLIIFLGENDISQETKVLIESRRTSGGKFGVNYGFVGTRAMLWIENLSWKNEEKDEEKKEFRKYYENTYSGFKKIIEPYNKGKKIEDLVCILGSGLVGLGIKKFIFEKIQQRNKVREAQYNACIMEFMKNGLGEFIETR